MDLKARISMCAVVVNTRLISKTQRTWLAAATSSCDIGIFFVILVTMIGTTSSTGVAALVV
jgi:hypothetical protein